MYQNTHGQTSKRKEKALKCVSAGIHTEWEIHDNLEIFNIQTNNTNNNESHRHSAHFLLHDIIIKPLTRTCILLCIALLIEESHGRTGA